MIDDRVMTGRRPQGIAVLASGIAKSKTEVADDHILISQNHRVIPQADSFAGGRLPGNRQPVIQHPQVGLQVNVARDGEDDDPRSICLDRRAEASRTGRFPQLEERAARGLSRHGAAAARVASARRAYLASHR